jgi:hypothetical protein
MGQSHDHWLSFMGIADGGFAEVTETTKDWLATEKAVLLYLDS